MAQKFDVCVLGATGLVGKTIIEILEQRNFPINKLYPLASARTAGEIIEFNGESVEVIDADTFDFSLAQIGFFSAGGNVSAKFAPIAAEAGCIVIDNTSEFRYDDDIPLVVPEVNPQALAEYRNRNIIANPNCSTIQMLVALKPIHEAVGIERINVSTYQSVSGAGKEAMDELAKQCADLLSGKPVDPKVFSRQIAFNVIPQIDVFQENGYTKVDVLGTSWGGGMAQHFAFQYPSITARLVLCATAPGATMVPGDIRAVSKMTSPKRYKDPEYMKEHFETLYGDGKADASIMTDRMQPPSMKGYMFQLMCMAGSSTLPLLPFLRMPTLIIAGDRDHIIPVINAKIMKMLILKLKMFPLLITHPFQALSGK